MINNSSEPRKKAAQKNKNVKSEFRNTFNKIEGNPKAVDKRRLPSYAEIEDEHGIPMEHTARIQAKLNLSGIKIRDIYTVRRIFNMDTSDLPEAYEDDELFIHDQQWNGSKQSNGQ